MKQVVEMMSNRKLMAMALNVALLASWVWGHGIPLRENIDEGLLEQGRELMRLKDVMAVSGTNVVGTWAWPSRIVVQGMEYGVAHNERDFRVFSISNITLSPVKGDIARLIDQKTAIECAFGYKAATSMPLVDFAGMVNVRILDVSTNSLYITHGEFRQNKRDCLTYKNLYLRISGSTNNIDFAISLLNAGLPESDRLPPLQSQSNP